MNAIEIGHELGSRCIEPAPRLPSVELLGDVPLTGPGYHIGEDTDVVEVSTSELDDVVRLEDRYQRA